MLPCPPPGDLPNPGVEPMCLMSLVLLSSLLVPSGKPIEILSVLKYCVMGHVKYYLKKKADGLFNTHSEKSSVYSFYFGAF